MVQIQVTQPIQLLYLEHLTIALPLAMHQITQLHLQKMGQK